MEEAGVTDQGWKLVRGTARRGDPCRSYRHSHVVRNELEDGQNDIGERNHDQGRTKWRSVWNSRVEELVEVPGSENDDL